jgi:hypothetical protein
MTEAPDDATPRGTAGSNQERNTLPEDVLEEAERLTRLAREAGDDAERETYRQRREELVAEHGYTARVRQDSDGDVLVCHPDDWVVDGSVDPERIEDLDRAEEQPLSGTGKRGEFEEVDDHNRELVAAVREEHGDVHGDNAAAFADFVGNHHAKRVENATAGELGEFLDEYFPRNAWPSDRQKAVVGQSLELLFGAAGEEPPRP